MQCLSGLESGPVSASHWASCLLGPHWASTSPILCNDAALPPLGPFAAYSRAGHTSCKKRVMVVQAAYHFHTHGSWPYFLELKHLLLVTLSQVLTNEDGIHTKTVITSAIEHMKQFHFNFVTKLWAGQIHNPSIYSSTLKLAGVDPCPCSQHVMIRKKSIME